MKLLVQTKGDYALYDLVGRQVIAAHRPSVVTETTFITTQRGGKIEVLEELLDEADDETLNEATDLAAALKALPRPAPTAPKITSKAKE